MTMFLPNPKVRPTGVEPGEFLEAPALPEATNVSPPPTETSSCDDVHEERRVLP